LKRRFIYAALLLVVLAGLIVPAVYSNRINSRNQAAEHQPAALTAGAGDVAPPADTAASGGAEPGALKPAAVPPSGRTAGGKERSDDIKERSTAPAAGPEEAACRVEVAVLGQDGRPLFGPAGVKVAGANRWADTALGALDATGLAYETKGWSGFVEAVAGQRNRGQSGWMYQVNGEIPKIAADQKEIKNGDRVIWWYSNRMGDPVPEWDGLANNKKE
jgi:hypothetical protein